VREWARPAPERPAAPPPARHLATSPETARGRLGRAAGGVLRKWSRGMVGRPPPRPSPQTARGRENGNKGVVAGSNSPLSARNERGGAGGGAPRGRSAMFVVEPPRLPAPQPPPAVLGEVGEVYEPGGGAGRAAGCIRSGIEFSPLREERAGRGRGGAPRGRSSKPVVAGSNSPLPHAVDGGEAGRGGRRRAQCDPHRRASILSAMRREAGERGTAAGIVQTRNRLHRVPTAGRRPHRRRTTSPPRTTTA